MDSILNAIQWPAMLVTLVAAWLVGSQTQAKRSWGFWCFILSNVLWVVWGWHAQVYALIALQFGLLLLNVRGTRKNDTGLGDGEPDGEKPDSPKASAPD